MRTRIDWLIGAVLALVLLLFLRLDTYPSWFTLHRRDRSVRVRDSGKTATSDQSLDKSRLVTHQEESTLTVRLKDTFSSNMSQIPRSRCSRQSNISSTWDTDACRSTSRKTLKAHIANNISSVPHNVEPCAARF